MESHEMKLGADHASTLTSMNNLAFTLKRLGRLESGTMSQSDIWLSDDASDSQSHHPTSDSEDSQPATQVRRGGLRPAGKTLASVPPGGLASSDEDEDEPTKPYNIDCKLSINKRRRAGESEPGIVTSLRKFWKRTFEPKLAEACAKKLYAK